MTDRDRIRVVAEKLAARKNAEKNIKASARADLATSKAKGKGTVKELAARVEALEDIVAKLLDA